MNDRHSPGDEHPDAPCSNARASARRTYTVEEAGELLGISRSTAYECVRVGVIPSIRLRRRIVIPAAAIDRMLADQG